MDDGGNLPLRPNAGADGVEVRGLLLGDAAPPARPPKVIAAEAMKTWSARWRPHD